jgi:hypothetical protein
LPKITAARQFLTACELVYGGVLTPNNDIPSKANTVDTYANHDNQKKYVHMYFAKYVGCWRAIRKRAQVADQHNLVSIGAGPLLCCAGWFWDDATRGGGATLRAYDILDWKGTIQMAEFSAFWSSIYTGKMQYLASRYMPDGVRPTQTAKIGGAQPIAVSEIGSGNVLLLPFILNHLVGSSESIKVGDQRHVFDWIEGMRRAGNTVVIADMLHRGDTAAFWQRVAAGLGAPPGSGNHNLDFSVEATAIAKAYASGQQNRRAGLIPDAKKAAVLCGTAAAGWSWMT